MSLPRTLAALAPALLFAPGPRPRDEAAFHPGEHLALAKVSAEAGLITNPPREIPFLRGYFEKAVSLLAMQNQGRIRIPVPAKPAAAATP